MVGFLFRTSLTDFIFLRFWSYSKILVHIYVTMLSSAEYWFINTKLNTLARFPISIALSLTPANAASFLAAPHFCWPTEGLPGWVDLEQPCVNSLLTGIMQWLKCPLRDSNTGTVRLRIQRTYHGATTKHLEQLWSNYEKETECSVTWNSMGIKR